MVQQLIFIHVGQFGIQSGLKFWELVMREQGVNQDGTLQSSYNGLIDPMFIRNTISEKVYPRAIFCDTDRGQIDDFKQTWLGGLLQPCQLHCNQDSAASNYARGRYTKGRDVAESVADAIQLLMADCDNISHIVMFWATGGGTGCGLSQAIMDK